VGHGNPMNAIERNEFHANWSALGRRLPRPRSILCVSAHWETRNAYVTATVAPETIHDFYGFPKTLFDVRYPAPGDPALARRVQTLVTTERVRLDPGRGLDHGAWTSLFLMYPKADIPVTQLSIQSRLGPAHHVRLGEALQPLRDEGVLIFASGGATHNLRELSYQRGNPVPQPWVVEFNEWLADAVLSGRRDDLIGYRERAPHAVRNHPTDEHLIPLFVALGAGDPGRSAQRLHSSISSGVISMDAYRFD
ncbi:MAG: 4,5-DOPA dioxygenase extradiol, partial [Burkholderiales bacterium]